MSLLLSCRAISKSFGDCNILNGIDLDIHRGERIGLIGKNGSGKSTLANIIFGILSADGGSIQTAQKYLRAVYLMQSTACLENSFGTVSSPLPRAADMGDVWLQASKMGLKKVQSWEDERWRALSGGEKMKMALAAVFASAVDLLILDEPSNNLDPKGIEWLLAELHSYKGTVLIISHDRYFLDQSVNRIIEIDNGELNEYAGNYSFYCQEKERRYASQLHQYQEQEKHRQVIEESIEQLQNWSAKAHRESRVKAREKGIKMGGKEIFRAKAKKMDKSVKSRTKRLEKTLEKGVSRPRAEQQLDFSFISANKRGKRLIEAVKIGKNYGTRCLFKDSSFYILNGEKVGIVGENGCGKSTLLQALMGELPLDQGQLFISPTSRVALVSQNMTELEEYQQVQQAMGIISKLEREMTSRLLVHMGLPADVLHRSLESMSPGEKRKLQIARAIIEEPDLLILDEPLNHLDLMSRETLEEALISYNGSILLVSHDRYMLENVCQQFLIFQQNSIKRTEGDLTVPWQVLSGNIQSTSHRKEISEHSSEEKLLLETRVAYLCHKLNAHRPGSDEYLKIDQELTDLIKQKRQIICE